LQVGKAESLLQSGADRGKRHRLPLPSIRVHCVDRIVVR